MSRGSDSVKISKIVEEGKKYRANLAKQSPAYFIKALQILDAQKPTFTSLQVLSLSELGIYYALTGKQDSAKYFYNKLMQNGIANKDDLTVAKANNGLGVVADYQADYETAIAKNMLALKYAESRKDSNGIASTKGNIANSYIRLRQYNKAIPLLQTAISIYTRSGLKVPAANNMNNLARAYKGLGNKTKELELKLRAFSMFKEANYKKGLATVSINLGVYYNGQNNIPEAKKYYYTALSNSRQINDKGNIAILFNNMADMYLGLNQLDSAKNCADSAYYYALKNGDKLSQFDALLVKSNILNRDGKYKDAQKALDAYIALKDSVYSDKMQRQVADMEVKYETEKKENQISLLNKENSIKALQLHNNALELDQNENLITQQEQRLLINGLELANKNQIVANQKLDAEKKAENIKALRKQTQIKDLELSNQKLEVKQRNLLIGLILVLFIATGGFAYAYYNRNKLKQQNLLQTEIYKQQEIATKSVFEGEQNERIRIARDLHDGIGQMLSVVKMNVSTLDERNAVVGGTMQLVDKTIAEVRHISHNLIPEALNFGLFSALQDSCDKINFSGQTEVILSVADEVQSLQLSKQNELSIYRIIQEVLNNMVKHAKASNIDIDITKPEKNLVINIRDNGQGFDTNKINESKGIGWKNISARVHLLDGQMKIESEKLMGTQIEISIPG